MRQKEVRESQTLPSDIEDDAIVRRRADLRPFPIRIWLCIIRSNLERMGCPLLPRRWGILYQCDWCVQYCHRGSSSFQLSNHIPCRFTVKRAKHVCQDVIPAAWAYDTSYLRTTVLYFEASCNAVKVSVKLSAQCDASIDRFPRTYMTGSREVLGFNDQQDYHNVDYQLTHWLMHACP